MFRYILMMPSYTYGQKAVKLLRSDGWKCELKRREGECGYDLHVVGDPNTLRFLTKNGIPFTVKTGGDSS